MYYSTISSGNIELGKGASFPFYSQKWQEPLQIKQAAMQQDWTVVDFAKNCPKISVTIFHFLFNKIWLIFIYINVLHFQTNKARMYLQPHYGNGVFSYVYLSARQH
jgi:hypothetical protein